MCSYGGCFYCLGSCGTSVHQHLYVHSFPQMFRVFRRIPVDHAQVLNTCVVRRVALLTPAYALGEGPEK